MRAASSTVPKPTQHKRSSQAPKPARSSSSSSSSSTASTALSLPPQLFDSPVSVVHALSGGFGQLHAGSLPDFALEGLRQKCWDTPCDAIHHSHTTLLIDPRAIDLLHQTDESQPHESALLKLPDGYILFAPRQKNQILSVIKDAPLCVPEETHPAHVESIAPNGAKTVFYSLVPDLSIPAEMRQSFRVTFHDGYTHANEISRFSMADHAIAQLAAAMPLDTEPRVILRADPLGTLFGQSLKGDDADLIKRTFLGLAQASPERIYDTPIDTSETLAKLLQLKNPQGNISLARLRDGVLGYRNRSDGRRTFIFVANSDDFHASAPVTGPQSLLHVYKMQYKDPTPQGARIFVHVQPGEQGGGGKTKVQQGGKHNINIIGDNNKVTLHGGSFGVPNIRPGEHTVQNVLGLIEMAMRYAGRENAGCGAFPAYCADQARERMQTGEAAMSDPLSLQAAREALKPPQLDPLAAEASLANGFSSSSEDDSSSGSDEELAIRDHPNFALRA